MMLPLIRRFRRLPPSSNNESSNPPGENAQRPAADDVTYYPNCMDVLKVRYLLHHIWQWTRNSDDLLPVEIVDMIVDAGEYWASTESVLEGETVIRKDQDQVLLTTVPLCYDVQTLGSASPKSLPHRTVHPCRRVIFTISSHDQGWGGGAGSRGQYGGSYSWFDAEILHAAHQRPQPVAPEEQGPFDFGPDHPHLLPNAHRLQSNRTAVGTWQFHTIVWDHLDDVAADSGEAEEIERSQGRGRATLDGSQVRALEAGDAIAVWGRARFGGWLNHVQRVSVRVFWAI
ncbi:hypothetical protein BO70DRAFT_342915 [Aspergillus heteromorphus CBS 117.55]|uniref:Uncharacterized protein n=1 Tax=Aspergillus heteromorphus CBS 117.55 TaxID=1448321 RepID=A0A317VAR5_9EURO|nr:uncharacterized protein BO70DRAFT_342915 [Aspergillus heteromorphus CBS 117.55]PWY71443.1 hypothetical protein BO70DRAFT_342915 [Aspergillus heteromorphus CBS 117.55]